MKSFSFLSDFLSSGYYFSSQQVYCINNFLGGRTFNLTGCPEGVLYSGRYFGDGFVKDYERVPSIIRGISRERMLATAREFMDANTWVLAGVSCGEKELLTKLQSKLEELFE